MTGKAAIRAAKLKAGLKWLAGRLRALAGSAAVAAVVSAAVSAGWNYHKDRDLESYKGDIQKQVEIAKNDLQKDADAHKSRLEVLVEREKKGIDREDQERHLKTESLRKLVQALHELSLSVKTLGLVAGVEDRARWAREGLPSLSSQVRTVGLAVRSVTLCSEDPSIRGRSTVGQTSALLASINPLLAAAQDGREEQVRRIVDLYERQLKKQLEDLAATLEAEAEAGPV